METPNDRLRKARADAGYETAKAAAEAFSWIVSTYTAHENGQNGLSMATAQRYAAAFRVTPQWLLFGGERPLPQLGIEKRLHEQFPPDQAREYVELFNKMLDQGIKVRGKVG